MPITINGSGTVTGVSAGGLPDGCITTDDIAANAVTQAKRAEQLTLGTSQATTSGTSIDFTGIPSWVKRITVMLNGVSTSGISIYQIQVGSGSFTTSGYSANVSNGSTNSTSTAGFMLSQAAPTAAGTHNGTLVLTLFSGNTWSAMSVFSNPAGSLGSFGNGTIALAGALDRVRITTVNGTDTFDFGSINIMYE